MSKIQLFSYVFSIVSAGVVGTAKIDTNNVNLIASAVILLVGGVICWLMKSVLQRTQEKLDIILDQLLPNDPPMKITDSKAKKGGSRRRYIGDLIPTLCCWILTIALFAEIIVQVIFWK